MLESALISAVLETISNPLASACVQHNFHTRLSTGENSGSPWEDKMLREKEDWRWLKAICFLHGFHLKSFHSDDSGYWDRANESSTFLLWIQSCISLIWKPSSAHSTKCEASWGSACLSAVRSIKHRCCSSPHSRECLQSEKDFPLVTAENALGRAREAWPQLAQMFSLNLPGEITLLLSLKSGASCQKAFLGHSDNADKAVLLTDDYLKASGNRCWLDWLI